MSKVVIFSKKTNQLNDFLSKFYSVNLGLENSFSWQKDFSNPVEISDIIAAYIDNESTFDIKMWITLDEDVFIKISSKNAENIIRYLFERYPY